VALELRIRRLERTTASKPKFLWLERVRDDDQVVAVKIGDVVTQRLPDESSEALEKRARRAVPAEVMVVRWQAVQALAAQGDAAPRGHPHLRHLSDDELGLAIAEDWHQVPESDRAAILAELG
jgi:hypothetical protein